MARLDVFYCAHWAVRNHELTGLPADWPEDIVGGAVWERRHALEWLLSRGLGRDHARHVKPTTTAERCGPGTVTR